MPISRHLDVEFHIPDEWWSAAGMVGFMPRAHHYRPAVDRQGRRVAILRLSDIEAVRRHIVSGEFIDHESLLSEHARVFGILVAIRRSEPLPAIEVRAQRTLPWALLDGTIRFYCSVACGFTHIPAVLDHGTHNL